MQVYILYITSTEVHIPNILGTFEFYNDAVEMMVKKVQENSNVGWSSEADPRGGITAREEIIENIELVTYKDSKMDCYQYVTGEIIYRIDESILFDTPSF